ncbi:MAG TPA: hypothetical protein ENH82_08130 [bacterium]|nr:hypothetical protein [bacterium]
MPSNRKEIPFVGPAYQSANVFLNAQQSINYYLEPYPALGRDKFALRGAPGLSEFIDLGTNAEVRGLLTTSNTLFAVSGSKLFRITTGGVATEIGSLNSALEPVFMALGNLQLMIVDALNDGYIHTLSGSTLVQITDPNFPGASSVVHQDGFFVITQPNSFDFNTSDFNDGLSWDPLLFSPANWKPDNLVAVFSDHRDLYLGGDESIEVYYNNGNTAGNFIFTRREGTEMQVGVAAKSSFAWINNGVLWLGRNENGQGQVFRAIGFQPKIVSSDAITEAINGYSTISDAIGYSYYIDNNPMYEITFPTADVTWVFNTSLPPSQGWSERRSRRTVTGRTVTGRHRVQNHAFFAGKHLMGGMADGKIYEHTRDAFDEDGTIMEATRTTIAFEANQDLITVNELQVLGTPGAGLTTGQGSDPVAIHSWSHDGGFTFNNERDIKIGKKGEYKDRDRVLQLGQARNWIFRRKITDAINRDILGGHAIIEVDSA